MAGYDFIVTRAKVRTKDGWHNFEVKIHPDVFIVLQFLKDGHWVTRNEKTRFRLSYNGRRFADSYDFKKLKKRYVTVYREVIEIIKIAAHQKNCSLLDRVMVKEKLVKEIIHKHIKRQKVTSVYEIATKLNLPCSMATKQRRIRAAFTSAFKYKLDYYGLGVDTDSHNGKPREVITRFADPFR